MFKKLFSQTAVYGISTVLVKFLNYPLSIYLTWILTKESFGEMNLYYSIIPFANAFITMGLTTGYFRFAARCETFEQKQELFSTIWIAVSVMSMLFFVVLSLFSDVLSYSSVRWYMVITAGIILIDNIKDLPLAALREQGRAKFFTVVNVTGVLVNVILCIGFYTFIPNAKESVGWVLIANLIASFVSLLMLMPSAMKLFSRKFSPRLLKTLTTYSVPLMLAGIMGLASDFIDRQMMNWLLPAEVAKGQIGIYSAVAKIAALMILFRQVYTLGAEPFFLQEFSKKDFSEMNAAALKYYIIAGLGIFIGCTLFVDPLGVVLGQDFREGLFVVPMLLMANMMTGVLVTLSFWYKQINMTNVAIWITMTGLVVTITLNMILLPRLGYEGAAWTRLVAGSVMVLLSYALGQKYYRVNYDLKRIALYFIVAMMIFALSFYTATLHWIVRYSLNILLILCYALMAYKLEWKKLKS